MCHCIKENKVIIMLEMKDDQSVGAIKIQHLKKAGVARRTTKEE